MAVTPATDLFIVKSSLGKEANRARRFVQDEFWSR